MEGSHCHKRALYSCLANSGGDLGRMAFIVSFTSWGEGSSLALVSHPSSHGVIVNISNGVNVLLHQPVSHPIFFVFCWLNLSLILILDKLRLAYGDERWC